MNFGKEIFDFATEIFHINRSITGEGVRQTLTAISKHIPNLEIKSVSSNTKVFDWVVPKEWKVNEAYIIDPNGKKICDFKKNNLYLVNYSIGINKTLSLKKLKKKLFSIPKQPNAIPYKTTYYSLWQSTPIDNVSPKSMSFP